MAIDQQAVVAAVSSLSLVGNDEGLIPAFGLYLTRHYAAYYNGVSYAFLHAAEQAGPAAAESARAALIEAGHICGFNTFGGIMLSQEWEAVVMPMVECREDWVYGMVAVVNALGWGRWTVEELVPGESLKVSISNSYESTGYLAEHGLRKGPGIDFLSNGAVSSVMNLIYHGDITKRPALDSEYYQQLFHSSERFVTQENACRACGDQRCEFVARRVSSV